MVIFLFPAFFYSHLLPLSGLCTPLLTTHDGEKLSKSNVTAPIPWLSEQKTSPFELYQYLRGIKDDDVAKYLSLLTFYPTEQLSDIVKRHMKRPELWHAQEKLAEQVTTLVHGKEGLESALKVTSALYKSDVRKLSALSPPELKDLERSLKVVDVKFDPAMSLLELTRILDLLPSDDSAEKVISSGGVYVNFMRIKDPDALLIRGTHILSNDISLVRLGKRKNVIVRWFDPEADVEMSN